MRYINEVYDMLRKYGAKRGQHYVDFDGVKMYYETYKQPAAKR